MRMKMALFERLRRLVKTEETEVCASCGDPAVAFVIHGGENRTEWLCYEHWREAMADVDPELEP